MKEGCKASVLLLKPLLGILILWLSGATRPAKPILLTITQLNLKHTQIILHLYDANMAEFQFKLPFGGLDGLSIWLILQVNIIIPIVIQTSGAANSDLIQLVNFQSKVVFYVLDILLFYISFEAVLIPKFYLIGKGSRNKKVEEAKGRQVIYTLTGSLFLLLAILIIYLSTGTTDYQILLSLKEISDRTDKTSEDLPAKPNKESGYQKYLFIGFFVAFAVKTPKWPFHIWLPIAHGESSSSTSVILAAILLKFGTYGFIRYTLPFFPFSCQYYLPIIQAKAIISIIYSCIAAKSLIDLKQIIAYSSIAHKNVGIIGIFSNDLLGISGAYLYSIAHGLVSGGLFLIVGFIYERYHSRILKYYRGLVLFMPLLISIFFLFSLSNLSFPLSLGFIGEILIFMSTSSKGPLVGFPLLTSILLPIYFILTFQKISFGSCSNYFPLLFQDLNLKEFHLCLPLLLLTIILGIFPMLLLNSILLPILLIL